MLENGAGRGEPEGGSQEQAPPGRLQQVGWCSAQCRLHGVGALHPLLRSHYWPRQGSAVVNRAGCRVGCIAPPVGFTCLVQAAPSCSDSVNPVGHRARLEPHGPCRTPLEPVGAGTAPRTAPAAAPRGAAWGAPGTQTGSAGPASARAATTAPRTATSTPGEHRQHEDCRACYRRHCLGCTAPQTAAWTPK